MFDANRLRELVPASAPYATQLQLQMNRNAICTPPRVSCFLGQIHVESQGFEKVVESFNYSTPRLRLLFGKHRISLADAERYGRNAAHPAHQQALANVLYGGEWGRRNLGNTQLGDGWRYRGRGLKMVTGRDNYEKFGDWFGHDVMLHPELLEQPHGAVSSAVWYWVSHKLNDIADTGDVLAVSRAVNLGSPKVKAMPIAHEERQQWTDFYRDRLWD